MSMCVILCVCVVVGRRRGKARGDKGIVGGMTKRQNGLNEAWKGMG